MVVSGALTRIVREVVGSLGPTGGASALEGQNRARGAAHGAGGRAPETVPPAGIEGRVRYTLVTRLLHARYTLLQKSVPDSAQRSQATQIRDHEVMRRPLDL